MKNFVWLILVVFVNGCFISGGTHGSLKSYQYTVPKRTLEMAVKSVISTNKNVMLDTTKAYNDTSKNDYYNDGNNYLTITITKNQIINDYTLKYAGDKKYWDTSKVSNIFICYAYDKDANGGSDGNGGLPWYKFYLKKKLIDFFENEFIDKVDKQLHQKHTSTD